MILSEEEFKNEVEDAKDEIYVGELNLGEISFDLFHSFVEKNPGYKNCDMRSLLYLFEKFIKQA